MANNNVDRDEFELWITSLRDDIRQGFKITHEKQDYTNGRVRMAEQEIAILKDRAEQATQLVATTAKTAATKSAVSGAGAGAVLLGLMEFAKWVWLLIHPVAAS